MNDVMVLSAFRFVETTRDVRKARAGGCMDYDAPVFTELFFTSKAIPGMGQICFNDKLKDLQKDAEELSSLFKQERPATLDVYGRFISVEHREGVQYDKLEDLLSAPVTEVNNLVEAFERRDDFRGTFGELIESVNDDDHERQWIDALVTALRWAFRSWWEIYGTYGGRLTALDVDNIHRFTQRAEQEVQSRGGLDPELLVGCFKEAVREIPNKQFDTYFSVYRKPGTNDGKLDRAFRDRDPKLLKECLDELKGNTQWFLKAAASRFAELVSEEAK